MYKGAEKEEYPCGSDREESPRLKGFLVEAW